MSGGGSKPSPAPAPTPVNTTVTNVNIPEWLKGPTLDVVGSAKALYAAPVKGYEEDVPVGQRIGRVAGFDPAQTTAFNAITGMGAPQGFQDANSALDQAQTNVMGLSDPTQYAGADRSLTGLQTQVGRLGVPSQYTDANQAVDAAQRSLLQMRDPRAYGNAASAFDRAQSGISSLRDPREFNIAGNAMMRDLDYNTGRFGAQQADFYMNPYAERVLDVSARRAREISDREAAELAARSASMGQFGGYGQNVAEAIRQRTLSQDIGDLYTRGLGEAYDKAAALYGQDEARRLEAANFRQGVARGISDLGARRQDAALARNRALLEAGTAQQGLGGELQRMALARAEALRNTGMSQAEIGSRQQADTLARQGFLRDLAVTRAELGSKKQADALARNEALRMLGLTQSETGIAQQRADLERLMAQSEVGKQRQALEQYKKDIAYQDYLRQRDLPMEKLKFYSDIVRGISPNLGSTSVTYAPQPSAAASILGAGLTGLGIYNQLRS